MIETSILFILFTTTSIFVDFARGQMPACPVSAPANSLPNFIDGNCDVANDIGALNSVPVTNCSSACLASQQCAGFEYWNGNCYFKSVVSPPIHVNVSGYSLYIRAPCSVSAPANGNATFNGTTIQGVEMCLIGICNVSFNCNAGYSLAGPQVSSCVTSSPTTGALSPPPPLCVLSIPCTPTPTAPPFGSVVAAGQTNGLFLYGATATFSCSAGYSLSSFEIVTCLSAGQWSSSFPTCIATPSGVCPPFTAPNGYVLDSNGDFVNPSTTSFNGGSSCTVVCYAGYATNAGINTTVYSCDLTTLTWMPMMSPCELGENGILCSSFTVTDGYVTTYSRPVISVGTAAYWSCNSGYTASGDVPVLCSTSGQWTYTNQPKCTSYIASLQNASNALPNFMVSEVPGLTELLNGGATTASAPTDSTAIASVVADVMPYILAGLTPLQNQEISYTLPNLLLDCSFAGGICKSSDVEFATFDPQLGNCYTFNHRNMKTFYSQDRPGEEDGVYLVFNVRQEEYMSFVQCAGMRVVIHDQVAQLIPQVMGFDISPGYLTTFSVEKITTLRKIRVPVPCISSPSDMPPSTPYHYGGDYSPEACLRSAVQSQIIRLCGCGSPMYAIPPASTAPACQLAQMSCVVNFTNSATFGDFVNTVSVLQCPDICNETEYLSTRVFSLLTSTAAAPFCQAAANSNMTCAEFTRNNLAIIRAYYRQLFHVTYSEHIAVTAEQLVAAFGGLLVIFFGMSIISCVECIFVAYETVRIFYRKLRGPGTEDDDEKITRKYILMCTINSVRNIGSAKDNTKIRLCWVACLLAGAGCLLSEISGLIREYQQQQTYVDITVTQESQTFPAVTFCNLNAYKKSLLQYVTPAQAMLNIISAAAPQ